MRERPRRNIVSFDVLIAFQMPAANLRWNPAVHRHRAIGGNVPLRYLGAPNSTCKLISPSLSMHTCPSESLSPSLSPKRLFNWSRIFFVIRCAHFLCGTRRSFRYGRSLFLAPVSFLSPRRLPFGTARRLVSDVQGMRTGTAWERADSVTRSGAEYGIVSCSGSYYGWCGFPLDFLTLSPLRKEKSLKSCSCERKSYRKEATLEISDNGSFAIFTKSELD